MHYVLKNIDIVTSSKIIKKGYLEIKNSKIYDFGEYENQDFNCKVYDCKNLKVFPGFIDCHTHGGYGVDFESFNKDSYLFFSKNLISEGVTSFLFTSVANDIEVLNRGLKVVSKFIEYQKEQLIKNFSLCLGIHLEGPFICKSKKGAHKEEYLLTPNVDIFKKLNKSSNNNIKIVTFCINDDYDNEFNNYLIENNVIGSIGHCDADSNTYLKYISNSPILHSTHLFNAMTGLENRKYGIASSILVDDNNLSELIVDNVHVQKELVNISYRCKTYKNICLITDSISAKGLEDGEYHLGELDVEKKGNFCFLKNSQVLAGSVAKYNECILNMKNITKCSDIELLYMTSKNIAKQLRIDNLVGDIKKNMLANLVIVDDKFNVHNTIIEGSLVYENEKFNKI